MNEAGLVVLDASAILAFILRERGQEMLTPEILDRSVTSTINIAEVQTKLVRDGYDPEMAWEDILDLARDIQPYTLNQARIAGNLITKTSTRGLSLGDRSCLALAITLNAPVYTTEQIWRGLDVGIPIHIIR